MIFGTLEALAFRASALVIVVAKFESLPRAADSSAIVSSAAGAAAVSCANAAEAAFCATVVGLIESAYSASVP